jgi:hypothetical protein
MTKRDRIRKSIQCHIHPKYRALRRPRADCIQCYIMYLALNDFKHMFGL